MPLKLPIFFRLICSCFQLRWTYLHWIKLLLYAIIENWHFLNRLPCGPWQWLRLFPLVQTLVRLGQPCFQFSALLDVEQQVSRTSSQRLQSTILRLVSVVVFVVFSMIGWLNYHVTFCRNDITCGVTLPQNGRKYPVNPYQLWTMSFCTARRASLRTLGSLWDIIFITLTLQPRFSSTLRIKEHTHSDRKHKSFVENSLR